MPRSEHPLKTLNNMVFLTTRVGRWPGVGRKRLGGDHLCFVAACCTGRGGKGWGSCSHTHLPAVDVVVVVVVVVIMVVMVVVVLTIVIIVVVVVVVIVLFLLLLLLQLLLLSLFWSQLLLLLLSLLASLSCAFVAPWG